MWVDPERIKIIMPTDFQLPPGGLGIRNPDPPMEAEKRLHGPKMAAVKAFVRANGFDRTVIDPPRARIGIMTTGKAYLDTRQALEDLGISEERAKALGIRLYKVGMTWPLEPEGARRFAEGLQEVIVIEEKRSNLEEQLVHLLYNMPADRRPLVIGKADETGGIILPSEGELTPTGVAMVIAGRLMKHTGESPELKQRLARLEAKEKLLAAPPPKVARTPFFCSGCPHNTSTRVPEGSRAMAGIGCHGMAIWMPERRTALISHMGGEGVPWVGQAPFSGDNHIFQNLGDGTYYHSGLMAIRAGRGGRRQHHLQDPVQRRGRHDRRPAARRAADRCPRSPSRSRPRAPRRSSSSPTSPTSIRSAPTSPTASASAIATSSTPCSASCATSRASPCWSTTRPAPPRSAAGASAAPSPIPPSACSSTTRCARAAATAPTRATACR